MPGAIANPGNGGTIPAAGVQNSLNPSTVVAPSATAVNNALALKASQTDLDYVSGVTQGLATDVGGLASAVDALPTNGEVDTKIAAAIAEIEPGGSTAPIDVAFDTEIPLDDNGRGKKMERKVVDDAVVLTPSATAAVDEGTCSLVVEFATGGSLDVTAFADAEIEDQAAGKRYSLLFAQLDGQPLLYSAKQLPDVAAPGGSEAAYIDGAEQGSWSGGASATTSTVDITIPEDTRVTLMFAHAESATANVTSMSDGTNTYVLVAEHNYGSAGFSAAVFKCVDPTPGDFTVTATWDESCAYRGLSCGGHYENVSGVQASPAHEPVYALSGTDGTIGAEFTPSSQPALIVSFVITGYSHVFEPGTGFTVNGTPMNNASGYVVQTASQRVTAATPITSKWEADSDTGVALLFTLGLTEDAP